MYYMEPILISLFSLLNAIHVFQTRISHMGNDFLPLFLVMTILKNSVFKSNAPVPELRGGYRGSEFRLRVSKSTSSSLQVLENCHSSLQSLYPLLLGGGPRSGSEANMLSLARHSPPPHGQIRTPPNPSLLTGMWNQTYLKKIFISRPFTKVLH